MILFRADSSSSIGTGHIMRNLVLASRFKNTEIIFVTQNLDGNINQKIVDAGYKIELLKNNSIEAFQKIINKLQPKKIVIDSYEIDFTYEKKLKENYPFITLLVFDDTYKKHFCDKILNVAPFTTISKYDNPNIVEIINPLIRNEFYIAKVKKFKKDGILLSLGGNDSNNLTINILQKLKNKRVYICTTSANRSLNKLKAFISKFKNFILLIDTDISLIMAKVKFAIITSSTIAYEALFMKLPFLAIYTAPNQIEMVKYLKQKRYTVLKPSQLKRLNYINF